MGQSYAESKDAGGRTVVAMVDDKSGMMLLLCALGVTPLLLFGWDAWPLVLAQLVVFGSLAAWYKFAPPGGMRVTLDPAARTLALGGNGRTFAFGDLVRAQLNSTYVTHTPHHPGGTRRQVHRVDLVLRDGAVVPLMNGFGQFDVEDCHRMVKRINAALQP